MSAVLSAAPLVIRMHERDNVAIVANDGGLPAGIEIPNGPKLRDKVPQGHKVALTDIAQGQPVTRYDVTIGIAARDIAAGSWVHERLLQIPAARALADLPMATVKPPHTEPLTGYTFEGYRNADGSVGTRNLLAITTTAELKRTPLSAPYDKTFAHLVPTTALIESCWRQYIVRGGKVTYLRSQSRSVGIMQINQHVWRGFYDVQRLRWDTAYNMRAGTQILLRYVKDYAIPYAQKTGRAADVPRAAYAVYNAGPKAVARFARAEPHPREKRVDDKLLALYQGVASGNPVDLESCGVRNPG